MNIDFKKIQNDFSSGAIWEKISRFFAVRIKMLIFALMFILSGYCIYVWYSYAFNYHWTEERQNEYLKTKDKEETFNRNKLEAIVKEQKIRAEEYQKTIKGEKNIFGI